MTGLRFFLVVVSGLAVSNVQAIEGVKPDAELAKLYTVNETFDSLGTDLAGENLDLNSGQVSFRHVDVSIPGNSALPVEFARTLALDGFTYVESYSTDAELGDWRIDVPKITTVLATQYGWPTDRCSNFHKPPEAVPEQGSGGHPIPAVDYWHGYHAHIPGKGTQELLQRGSNTLSPGNAADYPVVTSNHWMVECTGNASYAAGGDAGEGFRLHTPDGWTYDFNVMTSEAQPDLISPYYNPVLAMQSASPSVSGSDMTAGTQSDVTIMIGMDEFIHRKRYVMLASRVEDQFGNWVEYDYNSDGKLTEISSSDGRTIIVSYHTSGAAAGRVSSVSANGETWTYSYASHYLHVHLDEVELPDQRKWQFDMAEVADINLEVISSSVCQGPINAYGSASGSITHPLGATISFNFGATRHGRAGVHYRCLEGNEDDLIRAAYPNQFFALSLLSKTISGKNFASMTWTYDYSETEGWYDNETPGDILKWVDVFNPEGRRVRYWFDMRAGEIGGIDHAWREGNLVQTDYYESSATYRRVKYYYDLRGMNAGFPEQTKANTDRAKAIIRTSRQETIEDGAHFNWEVLSWDTYDNPLVRREYNSAGEELKKQYTYENRVSDWWLGQVKSVEVVAPADVAGLKPYEATFSTDGNIESVKQFGRTVGSYTWHGSGLLHEIIDPLGNKTTLWDYKRGRPRNISFPENGSLTLVVNDSGTIASVTDSRGNETGYEYDPLGRLTEIDYPGTYWDSTTFELAAAGPLPAGLDSGTTRRIRTTGSSVETTFYDALLRPVLTRRGSSYVRREFDSEGRKTFESYPSTNPSEAYGIHFTYDGLGRLVRTERDIETGGQAVETVEYETGNKRIVTNARGKETTYTYRNLSAPSNELLARISAPEGQKTEIVRDGLGAMTGVTRSGIYDGGVLSATREYSYNTHRDLCRVKDPETGVTLMGYDARGMMSWKATGLPGSTDCTTTIAENLKTRFGYDGKRRLILTNYPDGTDDTSRSYDTEGNLETLISGSTTWSYQYNDRNMIDREELAVDDMAFALDPAYNSRGQLASIAYPGNTQTVSFSPDAFGRPTRVGNAVTNVGYHPNDAVAAYDYANGTTMQMSLNTRRLPDMVSYPGINRWDYQYDNNGNITSVDHSGPPSAPIEDRVNFVYDGLDRLTAVDSPYLLGPSRFKYDSLDNLRYKRLGSRHQYYEYDANNRLDRITASEGGTELYDLSYDDHGNVTGRNSVTEFTFDDANRMTSATGGGDYVYDGHGRRVKITAPDGEVTYTVYSSSGQLMQEYKPALQQRTDYLYLGSRLVAEDVWRPDAPATAGALSLGGDVLNGDFTLSWSPVSSAARYRLAEKTPGGWVVRSDSTATSKPFSGRAGGLYTFRLAGCISEGCGEPGPVLNVGVAPEKPDLSVPTTVRNDSYPVNWTEPVSSTYFDLQEYTNGAWSTVANNTTDNSVPRPHVGGIYKYRVRAYNSYGTRGYTATSAEVKVKPPKPSSFSTNDSTAVDGEFELDWSNSAGADDYTVRRRRQSSSGTWGSWSYETRSSTSREYGYRYLSEGDWQFQVRGNTDGVGGGSWKGTVGVAVEYRPPVPDDIDSPASNHNGLYWVTWDSSSGALRYVLQVKHVEGSNPQWETIYNGSATSRYITDPTQGFFYYRVRACKVFACSGWTNATSTQVSTGEDCDDDPWLMQGMTSEGEASGSSDGDVVIMAPPCPIEP